MRYCQIRAISDSYEEAMKNLLEKIYTEVSKLERVITENFLFKEGTEFQPYLDSRNDDYYSFNNYEETKITIQICKKSIKGEKENK